MDNSTPKKKVIQILHDSFFDNGSIDFVIGSGKGKTKRLRALLDYSYKMGNRFGKIYLSEDERVAAIILKSDLKKTTIQSLIWEVKLLFKSIGIGNAKNVLQREKLLKQNHPKTSFIHLWYIGVQPEYQGNGAGTKMLLQILDEYKHLPIYLETSNPLNVPFYKKYGFKEVNELDGLGYALKVFLKPAFDS